MYDLEEQLKNIFTNINDWLKFAETKTAALLTANGLMIFGIIRTLSNVEKNLYSNSVLYLVVLLLIISLLLCLVSFIPSLKIPWLLKVKKILDNDNLLYFADIAKYDSKVYLEKLAISLEKPEYQASTFDDYYAQQIIINSIIALKKYRLFTFSIYFTVIAVILLVSFLTTIA